MSDYTGIPKRFGIDRDSVDNPLEEAESDEWVAKKSLTLTLITGIWNPVVFLKHGNVLGPVRRCRCDWYEPSAYGTVIVGAHIGPRDDLRLERELETKRGSCVSRSSALISLQRHFECTRRDFLSSRHLSHWETGRPLRFTSTSGRSVWLQEEVR